jgi:hypothetical protein
LKKEKRRKNLEKDGDEPKAQKFGVPSSGGAVGDQSKFREITYGGGNSQKVGWDGVEFL